MRCLTGWVTLSDATACFFGTRFSFFFGVVFVLFIFVSCKLDGFCDNVGCHCIFPLASFFFSFPVFSFFVCFCNLDGLRDTVSQMPLALAFFPCLPFFFVFSFSMFSPTLLMKNRNISANQWLFSCRSTPSLLFRRTLLPQLLGV